MAHDADYDLLRGLLAVRQGALSAAQCCAALRASAAHGRPLSETLVAQGLASATQCAEWDVELQALLNACQDDLARARAELARSPAAAAALKLLSGGDSTEDDAGATSLHLVTQTDAAIPPPPGPPPPSAARYRALKFHARGGLGVVDLGVDEELPRPVALKRIRAEHAHDRDCQQRFRREAEITAALQHPGIVPVYSAGTHADGTPFYAMRFIDGESLKAAIERHHGRPPTADQDLELRRLLGRFLSACQAVAYAHRQGVLHRDLKPGNIMLGEFGETLVVDWGLAKRIGEAGAAIPSPSPATTAWETQANSFLGTLPYASPEQAAGQLDALGPVSDVYALGATLYHLLTGRPPFAPARTAAEQAALVREICAGRFPSPGAVRRRVARPLDAICRRAMATEPAHRYASVEALAADLERFLADEPVAAHRESPAERLRRWIRRRTSAVVSAAVVLLLTGLGLGAFSVVLQGKNESLSDLTDSLDRRNGELRGALERESVARDLAVENAAAARRHGSAALAALRTVVGGLQAELRDLPGGAALRRRLLAESLAQLQAMSDQFLAEVVLDETECSALVELAASLMQFGGGPTPLHLGAPSSSAPPLTAEEATTLTIARQLLLRAVDLTAQRRSQRPGAAQPRHDHLVALTCLSALDELQGDPAAAEARYAEALASAAQWAASSPDDPLVLRDRALLQGRLGDVTRRSQGLAAAQPLYEQSLAALRELAAAAPHDVQTRRDVASGLQRMGDLLWQVGRREEAQAAFEERLALCAELAAETPDSVQVRRDLASAQEDAANACLQGGDLVRAAELLQSAQALRRDLAEADPADWPAQFALAVVLRRQGQLLAAGGRPERAAATWQDAAQRLAPIVAAQGDYVDAQAESALLLELLGDGSLAAGETAQAQARFTQALEIRARLAAAAPADRLASLNLGVALAHLADAALARLDGPAARDLLVRALQIQRRLAEGDRADRWLQTQLATTLERLGEALQLAGDLPGALERFQEARDAWTALVADGSPAREAHLGLAIAHENLGGARLALGDVPGAATCYEQALAIAQALLADDPQPVALRRQAAVFHRQAADIRFLQEDFLGAADAYAQAIELLQSLPEEDRAAGNVGAELSALEAARQFAARAPAALGDWSALLDHPPEEVPALLEIRGLLLVERGRYAEAAAAAEQLCTTERASATQLYNAGCALARCAAVAAEQAESAAWSAAALGALRQCIARGFSDGAQLLRDPDLAVLRDLPEFQALLEAASQSSPPPGDDAAPIDPPAGAPPAVAPPDAP